MPTVGIDLGGTKLAAAVFSDGGGLVHREIIPLSGRAGAAAGALIAERARELVAGHGCDAVGICVPGLYRATSGTVWAPNIPDWDDYPLRDELGSALGSEVRLAIDSDRVACILGETWQGAARGSRDAVFLAVGTGIGAGILAAGRVVRGHGDTAGAIGWLALDRPFNERYAGHGCFEDQASGPGLVRVAIDAMARDPSYRGELSRMPPEALTAEHVLAAHANGDTVGVAVIANAIELWGMAAANLTSLFDPELIVFGGGVFGPARELLGAIHREASRWGQPLAMRRVRFVGSALGGDAGIFGAARLAQLSGGDLS